MRVAPYYKIIIVRRFGSFSKMLPNLKMRKALFMLVGHFVFHAPLYRQLSLKSKTAHQSLFD